MFILPKILCIPQRKWSDLICRRNLSGNCRCGYGCGRAQVYFGAWMTGTALEVTGSGADQHFVLADDTLAASPADAAVRVHDDGSGLHEGVDDAFF